MACHAPPSSLRGSQQRSKKRSDVSSVRARTLLVELEWKEWRRARTLLELELKEWAGTKLFDVRDHRGMWELAEATKSFGSTVHIHYVNWSRKYDEIVPLPRPSRSHIPRVLSDRFATRGSLSGGGDEAKSWFKNGDRVEILLQKPAADRS